MEARRKKASALRLRHSQSLASLASRRQRLSHARVRSTIQRLGTTLKPMTLSARLTISTPTCRENVRHGVGELRSLIAAVGEQLVQERKHPEQRRHHENAAVAIVDVGRMDDGVQQQA